MINLYLRKISYELFINSKKKVYFFFLNLQNLYDAYKFDYVFTIIPLKRSNIIIFHCLVFNGWEIIPTIYYSEVKN